MACLHDAIWKVTFYRYSLKKCRNAITAKKENAILVNPMVFVSDYRMINDEMHALLVAICWHFPITLNREHSSALICFSSLILQIFDGSPFVCGEKVTHFGCYLFSESYISICEMENARNLFKQFIRNRNISLRCIKSLHCPSYQFVEQIGVCCDWIFYYLNHILSLDE